MANHKQALKRHKQSLVRADRNRYYMATARTYLKRARQALSDGDQGGATTQVGQAISYIDHIAGKGIIHRNKASRIKSRLTRQLQALG